MSNGNAEVPEKTTTTIEVDKELFLKFKALCVLRELKISSEIEKMIREWVGKNGTGIAATNPNQKKLVETPNPPKKAPKEAPAEEKQIEAQMLTDKSLEEAEKQAEG